MTTDQTDYYLVFAAKADTAQDPNPVEMAPRQYTYQHRPTGRLIWFGQPVGLFRAPTPEAACQSAARASGSMGTFFAVPGTPWGVSLLDAGGTEVGLDFAAGPDPTEQRIAELEAKIAAHNIGEAAE